MGDHPYRPQLPSPITGFTTQPDGTQETYFTAASIAAGGPAFRVRATKSQSVGGVRRDRPADQRPDQHVAQPVPDRARRHRRCARLRPRRRVVAGPPRACARWRTSSARPTPSPPAISTSGSRAPTRRPRSVAWPGRSTSCSNGSRRRLTARLAIRGPPEGVTSSTCASSSPTPRTSSARPSRRCRPTPSCSSAAPPSTPTTCHASCRGSARRPHAWTASSPTSSRWLAWTRACPWSMAPVELVSLASEAVRTATAVGPEWPVRFWAARPGGGDRRQGSPPPGHRQPARQRPGAHAARGRRPPCGWTRSATRPRSKCATPGPACPTRRPATSSSASTGSTRRGRAPAGAAASASPSSRPSWPRTAARSRPRPHRVSGMTVTVRIPMSSVELATKTGRGGRATRVGRLMRRPVRAVLRFTPGPQPTFTEPGGAPGTMQ